MTSRQLSFKIDPDEIIVDSFAGGGGASLGIQWALGRGPHVAINHDREAIALHAANHPDSEHYSEDVWHVDPVEACRGRKVGLMWLSPDCKHFSKAKGGKPVSKKIRGLAWTAVRWANAVRPRVIVLENVEEFQTWGPVDRQTSKPIAARRGQTFRAFVARLDALGYVVEWRELRACDYGAPTIRKRLFLIARCDGQPIAWPAPTYGKGREHPWRTAAECIDWSIVCPSIFERKRALAPNTMRRIARGIDRFVINSPKPFIVNYHAAKRVGDARAHSIDEPTRTVTGAHRGEHALIAPFLKPRYGEDPDPSRRNGEGQAPRVRSLEEPAPVIVPTGNGGDLVAAFMAKHYGGHETPGTSVDRPLSTATTQDHHHLVTAHIQRDFGQSIGAGADTPLPTVTGGSNGHAALVASNLVKFKGTARDGQPVDEPLPTVQSGGLHYAEVRAFLAEYYGSAKDGASLREPLRTVTSRDRFALVTVEGIEYAIVDIGMRMLAPRELYRAQGFPDSYRIDVPFNGKPLTKTAQVRMCGNSVCPPLAAAIVAANLLGETFLSKELVA